MQFPAIFAVLDIGNPLSSFEILAPLPATKRSKV